jgi:NAD(P)H-hydrate epimerase
MGAPYFAAMSFLKAGGGYSRLATPRSISPFLANRGSEIVMHPMEETPTGSLSLSNLDRILEIASGQDFVVIGPGISLEEETGELTRELTRRLECPLLLDGDGITAVCEDLSCVSERKGETVLTPHPGEMARLADISVTAVLSDRVDTLRRISADLEAIVVLKRAHSLIGRPDGMVRINLSGNPGMGSAGSGDVLTGTIAAMHGLGLGFEEAVGTGVFVHGLADDLAANERGEDGITAGDVLENLPMAMKVLREDYDELVSDCYDSVFVI